MARIAWTAAARSQYERAVRGLGRHSVRAAERWVGRVRAALARVEAFPEIGPPVEDTRHPGLREQVVDSYRVVYRYNGTECQVVGVVHVSADLDHLLDLEDPA